MRFGVFRMVVTFERIYLDTLAVELLAGERSSQRPVVVAGIIDDVVHDDGEYDFYSGKLRQDLSVDWHFLRCTGAWIQLEFGSIDRRAVELFHGEGTRSAPFAVIGWYTSEERVERRVSAGQPYRIGRMVVHRVQPVCAGFPPSVLVSARPAPQELYTLESRESHPVVTSDR